MTVLLKETNSKGTGVHHRWALGPPIHAQFTLQDLKIYRIRIALAKEFSCSIDGEGFEEEIFDWMDSYSKRQKGPPLPLILSSLTPFTRKGLKAIDSIEMGDVASYGEIASRAGCAKGARAIGNVCNKNPYPLVIPCHRVIQGDGSIGGFAYNLRIKKTLLAYELTMHT